MRRSKRKLKDESEARRLKRRLRIRKIVVGTLERPRVSLMKSNRHFFVQVIDDGAGNTLYSAKTFGKNGEKGIGKNKEGAGTLGKKVAIDLKSKNIEKVVFDRAGHKFHGVLAAFVDALREGGIQI